MKPETAKRLAEQILKTLHDVGLPVDEFMSALNVAPVDDHAKELIRQVVANQFAQDVAESPEPTPEELAEWLEDLDRLKTTPRLIREKLQAIRKGLPRTPGGPQRRIPEKEEPRVCSAVEALVVRGYDRRTAVEFVATKRNASVRTVNRILQKHGKTKPSRPRKTAVK